MTRLIRVISFVTGIKATKGLHDGMTVTTRKARQVACRQGLPRENPSSIAVRAEITEHSESSLDSRIQKSLAG